jgi:putative ABC transport system permease protein
VVGVVGNVRHNGITADVKEQWYLPDTQFHLSTGIAIPAMTLVIKTQVPPAQLVGPIREAILAFDPKLPVANVADMDQVFARAVSQPRSTMLLMILAAALALVLAVVGAYGVVGYSVSQRTHEIGLRMALGAEPRNVMAMIVGQSLMIVALGIVLGGVTAQVVLRFLASLLFGVATHDPVSYLCGALLLLLVASGASLLPARRAARIDPGIALRGC